MICYIAMLRGINVSGQKIIKMEHLRSVFEDLHLGQVRTYIQSGNVLFVAKEQDISALETTIVKKLEEVYGYHVPVMVRTHEELLHVIDNNPFAKMELAESDKIYVAFLSHEPSTEAIQALMTFINDVDDYILKGREVYILARQNYGKSLFSNNFLEKKLKVSATTRNWATVNKLSALSES